MLCIVSNTAYRLWCFGCLLWWKLLTIDPAAIRLNISLLVKHSTKTIHHHYHHNFSKTYVKKWRTATKVNTPILPSYETSEWNWQSVLRSTITYLPISTLQLLLLLRDWNRLSFFIAVYHDHSVVNIIVHNTWQQYFATLIFSSV